MLPVPANIAAFLHTLGGLDICQILKSSAEMQMKETMFTGQQQLDHLSAAACFIKKKRYIVQVCVVQAANEHMICAFMLYNTCIGLQRGI